MSDTEEIHVDHSQLVTARTARVQAQGAPKDDGWRSRKFAAFLLTFAAICNLAWILASHAGALKWAVLGLVLLFGSYAGANVVDAKSKLQAIAKHLMPGGGAQ